MTTRNRFENEDELIDKGLEALADEKASKQEAAEREQIFAELSARLDQPGIQDKVLSRYGDFGRALLADSMPTNVDPSIARALRPYLGDISHVRVHTGRAATEAARAMEARAFAIGDQDIFVDSSDFAPGTKEGGALLAHEIAHTRDASTGFALSGRFGNDTAAREQFAEQLEMLYALEFESGADEIAAPDTESKNPVGNDLLPQAPEIDQRKLARMVYEVLQDQAERARERTGQYS
jgi:hypothetical protein